MCSEGWDYSYWCFCHMFRYNPNLNKGMRGFIEHLLRESSITTDRQMVKKSYGSFHGQGSTFVWVAMSGGKIYKTGKIGSVDIADAKARVGQIAKDLEAPIDTMRIIGRDGKVLADVKISSEGLRQSHGDIGDLGDLDKPEGTGKARKVKRIKP